MLPRVCLFVGPPVLCFGVAWEVSACGTADRRRRGSTTAAARDATDPGNTGYYPKTYFTLYLLHSGYIVLIPVWFGLQAALPVRQLRPSLEYPRVPLRGMGTQPSPSASSARP